MGGISESARSRTVGGSVSVLLAGLFDGGLLVGVCDGCSASLSNRLQPAKPPAIAVAAWRKRRRVWGTIVTTEKEWKHRINNLRVSYTLAVSSDTATEDQSKTETGVYGFDREHRRYSPIQWDRGIDTLRAETPPSGMSLHNTANQFTNTLRPR